MLAMIWMIDGRWSSLLMYAKSRTRGESHSDYIRDGRLLFNSCWSVKESLKHCIDLWTSQSCEHVRASVIRKVKRVAGFWGRKEEQSRGDWYFTPYIHGLAILWVLHAVTIIYFQKETNISGTVTKIITGEKQFLYKEM